jgi:hypothetical protein
MISNDGFETVSQICVYPMSARMAPPHREHLVASSEASVDAGLSAPRLVRLEGPPPNLEVLLENAAEQFGSGRRLVPGHRDQGLADQFRRMQRLWACGNRDAAWFGARSSEGDIKGAAIVTKAGLAWSNRAFAGGPPLSEFAYAFSMKEETLGLRDFTLAILRSLEPEWFPIRVYGYALSQAVGFWARCAPAMGAVAAHNVLGVPCWIWLDRSLVGTSLVEPSACADAVTRFPARYSSGPALDPAIALSVGTVRAYDSPFAPRVRDARGAAHPLSMTDELAGMHRARVAAAFDRLPDSTRHRMSDHFRRLGLLGGPKRAALWFWLRFAPTVLLEDRIGLWTLLDSYTRVRLLMR